MADVEERLYFIDRFGRSDLSAGYSGQLDEITPLSPAQQPLPKRQFIHPVAKPLQQPAQKRQFMPPLSTPLPKAPLSLLRAVSLMQLSAPQQAIMPAQPQPLSPATPPVVPVSIKLKKQKKQKTKATRAHYLQHSHHHRCSIYESS